MDTYTLNGRTYPSWVNSDYERHLWDADPYSRRLTDDPVQLRAAGTPRPGLPGRPGLQAPLP